MGPRDNLNTEKSSQRTGIWEKDILLWTNGAPPTEACSWLEREGSWRTTGEYSQVGLLGGEAAVVFAPAAAATGDAAVVRGVAGVLLTVVLGEADEGGFESEVRFSAVFASATWKRTGYSNARLSPRQSLCQQEVWNKLKLLKFLNREARRHRDVAMQKMKACRSDWWITLSAGHGAQTPPSISIHPALSQR